MTTPIYDRLVRERTPGAVLDQVRSDQASLDWHEKWRAER